MRNIFPATLVFFGATFFIRAQTVVPLQTLTYEVEGITVSRLAIYVGINGGAPKPYLFDTGSGVFAASYSPAATDNWWGDVSNIQTISSDIADFYGTSPVGGPQTGFLFNAVTVPTISFYSLGNLDSPVLALNGSLQMGQVTQSLNRATHEPYDYTYNGWGFTFDPAFTESVDAGQPFLDNYFFGILGAGAFTQPNDVEPSFVEASVLGQATTSGWIVAANGENPALVFGLNDGLRSQFATQVSWTETSPDPFPGSGANAGTEFGLSFDFTVGEEGQPPTVISNTSTLLDTGTPTFALVASAAEAEDVALVTDSEGNVVEGYQVSIFSDQPDPEIYSFTVASESDETYSALLSSESSPQSIFGIGFFLDNSVLFDLENQVTGYTALQVVPEPHVTGLLIVAAAACLARRCKATTSSS